MVNAISNCLFILVLILALLSYDNIVVLPISAWRIDSIFLRVSPFMSIIMWSICILVFPSGYGLMGKKCHLWYSHFPNTFWWVFAFAYGMAHCIFAHCVFLFRLLCLALAWKSQLCVITIWHSNNRIPFVKSLEVVFAIQMLSCIVSIGAM